MLSRWVAIGLSLGMLLTSVVATAQPLENPIPESAIGKRGPTSSLQDVAVMWLYVVKDRRVQAEAFTKKELNRKTDITVDGYVTGVVLLCAAPLAVFVDRQPASPIRATAEGYYNVKFFGDLSRNVFWSTFLSNAVKRTTKKQIRNCYSRFPKVPGNALSGKRRFRIAFVRHGRRYHLTIHQHPRIKLDMFNHASKMPGTAAFYYLGDNVRQFDRSPKDTKQRMEAILKGIRAADAATISNLVKQVDIIDVAGPHNALTCEGRNTIWIYNPLFWSKSLKELRIIAEHECMHILSDRLGLPTNPHIRELYAELMGFGAFSRERFCVLASGRPSGLPRPAGGTCRTGLIFDFISEYNFLRGASGGHAQDDVNEFCASFLHTLMYIGRLGPMLTRPIKTRGGALLTLSTAQQAKLLNQYKSVLTAMIKALPGHLHAPVTSLLHKCLATADRIALPSGIDRLASNRQH
jgi:hypothetical protein